MKRLLVAIFAWLVLLDPFSATVSAQEKPNIILIMADDVGWECFGAYGADDYQTPNIDALAARGVRFDHCYSTPICTPSRVKIMTGKYSFRNYTHFGYLPPKEKTFGHLLQAAGYQTAVAGKWQLNGLYHGAQGCEDTTRPNKAGFDEWCLWQVTKQKNGPGGGERFWSPPLEHNGKFLTSQDNAGKYGPDIMSDFVCEFIKRDRDQPFFVYYPTVLVHNPFVPTPDTIGDAPRDHAANKTPKSKAAQKANFVAMVGYMDKIVGKIAGAVEAAGQSDNTIIIFTADNGTNTTITSSWNGQQIRGGKAGTKDMGTHVPMVAYWKGQMSRDDSSSPVVLDDLIDFTDFYSTFAEAAGVSLGKDDPIDGRSFLPQLKGEKGQPREWVLCHYQPYWGKIEGSQFARNDIFKLYSDGEFYRVPKDLLEKNKLLTGEAGEPGEAVRQRLQEVLNTAPPAPAKKGGRNAKVRPVYSDWKDITNVND